MGVSCFNWNALHAFVYDFTARLSQINLIVIIDVMDDINLSRALCVVM